MWEKMKTKLKLKMKRNGLGIQRGILPLIKRLIKCEQLKERSILDCSRLELEKIEDQELIFTIRAYLES